MKICLMYYLLFLKCAVYNFISNNLEKNKLVKLIVHKNHNRMGKKCLMIIQTPHKSEEILP